MLGAGAKQQDFIDCSMSVANSKKNVLTLEKADNLSNKANALKHYTYINERTHLLSIKLHYWRQLTNQVVFKNLKIKIKPLPVIFCKGGYCKLEFSLTQSKSQ